MYYTIYAAKVKGADQTAWGQVIDYSVLIGSHSNPLLMEVQGFSFFTMVSTRLHLNFDPELFSQA